MKRFSYLISAGVCGLLMMHAACTSSPRPMATEEGRINYVDPYIGSGGHGHVFVGANVPFGIVQAGPQNIHKGWDWCSGYHYSDSVLIGFSHTHLSGTGCADLGDVLLMPFTGEIRTGRGEQDNIENTCSAYYSHDKEQVSPGYYSLTMENGIRAELTATDRTAIHRYTYPEGTSRLLINLKEGNGDKAYETGLKRTDEYTIEGYRFSKGWSPRHKVFFVLKTEQPIERLDVFRDDTPAGQDSLEAPDAKGVLTFEGNPRLVQVKVGLSSVSCANARMNLEKEMPVWDFDGVRAAAAGRWEKALACIDIESADERSKKIFYTSLYHLFVAPTLYMDVNGEFRGHNDSIYQAEDWTNYSTFSLWDTYRTYHPLMTIIQPRMVPDWVNSMLSICDQQGKLPIWPLIGGETNQMPGYSALPVIADAYLKGFQGFDAERALTCMAASATYEKQRGIPYVLEKGYIPCDKMPEATSIAMEYAVGDWGLARMARKMGRTDIAQTFEERGRAYEKYFDRRINFIRPKMEDGSWRSPYDPFRSVHGWGDFCEGNGWQYTFFVPQNPEGLIDLMGGDESFAAKLDSLFVAEGDMGEHASSDISGLIGMYAHGNEPSHHVAYLYAYAGQQWKTAEIVDFIQRNFYTDKPDGIIGNEDCGQMSAWHVLSALGFYQVNPSNGVYVFGCPLFEKATIRLPEGKTFKVMANKVGNGNKYIQSVRLNGKPYTKSYITYKDIMRGGTLTFEMGPQPNKEFGVLPEDRPRSKECFAPQTSHESMSQSDYYTRGIGIYPGNPKEDFSPRLMPDSSGYRNLALRRASYQSSAYDYNLTAQLTTDGIVTESLPQYLTLSTLEGNVPKREREWMIDGGPYSRNTVRGEDTYFQFSLGNYAASIEEATITGTMAYEEASATQGYEMTWEASADGINWTTLSKHQGKGLPGKASSGRLQVNDPNKQADTPLSMPVRNLTERFTFHSSKAYAHYRIRLKMEGAYQWTFHEITLSDAGKSVELKPSQFFTSAWMSATSGEEWVYVDLGVRSSLDKVILHWINKAIKGKIQVSDDAAIWTDAADLPGGTVKRDEISIKKKARYVRVWMEEPANGENYILSELEVMGRGGLSPRPAPIPKAENGTLLLSGGDWKLQRASEVNETGEVLASTSYEPTDWIVATVPGTVLSSYLNIGALPNPNYADNQLLVSESFFNSNFWYRNEFEIPANFQREKVFLCFDGINWKANIYLNGRKAGRIEGAFIRGRLDVTDLIRTGKNVLAVEIVKNEHIGAVKEKNKQSTDFNGGILGADNPTFHATIGWDWIPTIRGRNIGIWNDVKLVTTGPVTVQDPYVQTVLALPDTTSARLTPEVVVKNHDGKTVQGILSGRIGDIHFEQPVELKAREEKTVRFTPDRYPQLNMQHPRLWWPNGYGTPHLYDANFTFRINDAVSDSKDFKTGVRQLTYNEDNHTLNLYINGRRFVGRGGNWGFSELNLNYRKREYETAVAYHADMHFTMLRNWVGMTGDEELYEACDRHGILIWQDFWLANPADGPNPLNETIFLANAKDYVKRIRNHASVGLYCGRNEGFPPESIDQGLRKIVKEGHPDVHYISSSADDVVSGHGPYRMLPAKTYFTLETGNDKFHSERGMPNVMTYESFLRTYSPKGIWPQSDEWGLHDYTLEGAQGAASFNEIIAQGHGSPQNVKEFTELAQWVNYDGHRSLFESRSKHRMGLLMWMSHPCWPSMVWQTYDYYFEPTAAYFGIKKACEPLHIQWNPATDYVEVVNYSAGFRSDLTVCAQVLNMDASMAWEQEASITSEEDTTRPCIRLEFPNQLSKVHFIKLTLWEGNKIISENFYLRSKEENNYQDLKQLPNVSLQAQMEYTKNKNGCRAALVKITNPSQTPALLVRLNLTGDKDGEQILPVFYSDNYFSLMPGERKEVCIRWQEVDTRGNGPQVEVSGYNVEEP